MKGLSVIMILLITVCTASAQGKWAGTKKSLIGKAYNTDSRTFAGLNGWTSLEASVLTRLDDPEMITVDVFQKGTTRIVFFSIKEDTASDRFTVADVLEIKSVTKGWTIKTSLCRLNQIENSWIVAWIKETKTEYIKLIKKAWKFNPDKRRIETLSIKGIDCLNEGFDQD